MQESKESRPTSDAEKMPAGNETAAVAEKARQDAKFGIAFSEQLADIDEMVATHEQFAASDPDKKPMLEVAKKHKELFLAEHDQAGAFKFKRLGREMQGFLEQSAEGERVVEVKDGKLALAEGQENRRFMFVNMGELDRFNKEGGSHTAGDNALKETARAIEAVIRDTLKDGDGNATYSLLRYSGNEYAVSFENISEDDLKRVIAEVEKQKPTVGGLEPAPLVAEAVDFKELLDTVNDIQKELGPDHKLDMTDPRATSREIMEVMTRRANYSLDAHKFRSRIDRVQQVVENKGEEEAQKFFKNYMEKLFKGTEFSTLADIKAADPKRVRDSGFEFASKKLGENRATEDAKRAVISARVREIREQRSGVAPASERPQAVAEGVGEVRPKLAEIPELTDGMVELKKKALLVEAAADRVRAGAVPVEYSMADLEHKIEAAKRDKGTGLLERGVYFEDLEKDFKEGKETSVAFIDMGFLKYFDNKGGPDVGDNALKMAAKVIEDAIKDAGVEGAAYRYGGDEFTVKIAGGPDALVKFSKKLDERRKAAGAIPPGKRGARDGYYPTELSFNSGMADMKTANEIFENLKAKGKYTEEELAVPGRENNIKAEIMTLLADKGVTSEKATDRFFLLAGKIKAGIYRKPELRKEPPPTEREIQLDHMISASGKAIFSEKGGSELLELLASSDEGEMEKRARVADFLEKAMGDADQQESKKQELLDTLVEMHSKISYFSRELDKLDARSMEQETEIEGLKEEKLRLQGERDALIDVRKKLE